jgi:hypothetical protein
VDRRGRAEEVAAEDVEDVTADVRHVAEWAKGWANDPWRT